MSLELGKQYTWKEIAEAYPDMFAIYKDSKLDTETGIVSCVLLSVCLYEEIDSALADAIKQYGKARIMRTTDVNPLLVVANRMTADNEQQPNPYHVSKSLEFGKRYTWEEIAKAYPEMYAIYKDGEYDPVVGDIISCVLLDICPYEERDKALDDAINQYGDDVNIMRTTDVDFVVDILSRMIDKKDRQLIPLYSKPAKEFTVSLEFGKRYTWAEIAEAYPDMYAIYKDDVLDPVEEITSCVLLDICPFEERDKAYDDAIKQYGDDVDIMLTTEGDPFDNGVLFW